jgi:hypothetical protein
MSSHLFQPRQNAVHVLIRIHEDDDHGELSPGVYQVTGLNPVSTKKPGHGVDCGCGINVFPSQVVKDFHM